MVLFVFAQVVLAWFSRYREFRADSGGADLTSAAKMKAGLQRLKAMLELPEAQDPRSKAHTPVNAFMINKRGGFLSLLSTHPPIDERIARLEQSIIK